MLLHRPSSPGLAASCHVGRVTAEGRTPSQRTSLPVAVMNKTPTATLQFLAKQLDIHVSTVSRVLQGNDEVAAKAASKATIERIRKLAAQYNYQPNPHAISLRTKKSRLIGVSVPRLSDYIWASIYEGIEEAALKEDYFAYVTNSYDRPELRQRQTDLALSRRVDGMIFGDIHTTQESLDFLQQVAFPFVLVLRKAGEHLSVTCDDLDGGRQAAQHLFERGHREVAVIGGSEITSTGLERTAGFTNFYREAGYPIAPERILFSHFDTQSGRDSAQQLLAAFPSLTALYAVNDFAAIGAMGAIREAGYTLGTDMALVGYNDTPLAAELPIPLTTVRNPFRELGERASEVLRRRLRGEKCASMRLQPHLQVRGSSAFTARPLP